MTDDFLPRIIRQAEAQAPVPHELSAPLTARTPLTVALADGVVFANTGPSLRHDKLIRLHARAAARLFGGLPKPLDANTWDGVVDTILNRMRRAIAFAPDRRDSFGLPPLMRTLQGPVALNELAPEGVARYVLETLSETFGLEGIEAMRADRKLAGDVFYPLIAELHNHGRCDGDVSRREKDVSYDIADGLFSTLLERQHPSYMHALAPGQIEEWHRSSKAHHDTIGIRRLTHAAIFVAQTFGDAGPYGPQKDRAAVRAHWRNFLGGKLAARDAAELQQAQQQADAAVTFDFGPLPPSAGPKDETGIRGLQADS